MFDSIYSFAQNDSLKTTVIKGVIKNKDGKFVEGANVVLEGTIDGTTSDEKGYYEFETKKSGTFVIIFSAVDFGEKKMNIEIESGKDLTIDINLTKTEYQTDVIDITASSFTSGENSRVTLTPLEIARIPGADADLYRAITTFPGSNQVDEGSRIAVRGGDPSEVLTYLDGASLYNPFIFSDSYNSSSFSTVNPWGMKGINFSSGGFSSRFGNVLSAVLDLQSYDLPTTSGMFAILGLANAGLSGVYVTKNGKFGATFSGGQFFVKPFFELNGLKTDYSPVPTASNLGGTLAYKISRTSLVKFYANYSYDNIGIRNQSPTYNGYYMGKSHNFFTNLKHSFTPTTSSLLNTSISLSTYKRDDEYGVLNTNSKSIYAKLRSDFSLPVTDKFDLSTGVEYEYNDYGVSGKVPVYPYNMGLTAPAININYLEKNNRAGIYVDTRLKVGNYFLVQSGVRSDYYSISKKTIFDPRLSLVFKISDYSFIKGATGIYHQNQSLQYFAFGQRDLDPQQATHFILGYEYNRNNDYILRVESFYKKYSNLISYSQYSFNYTNDGSGFVKGVDVFLKVRLRPKFNGWISYSIVDSKRKQYDAAKETSADFDITHTLSVVGTYNITNSLTVGATYRVSTGRPFTPLTGSAFDSTQSVYVPFYALKNSDRFPTYQRVDLNAQYIFALFGKFAVAFFALNNALNTKNLYEYNYNFDYTQRREVFTTNERTIYFGIGLQL